MGTFQLLSKIIDKIAQIFAPADLLADEDRAYAVRPLVTLSVIAWVVSFFYAILWIIMVTDRAERVILPVAAMLPAGLSLLFIRLHKPKLATAILLSGVWVVTTMAIFSAGGTRAPVFGLHIVIVIVAALLSGWRLASYFASITMITGLFFPLVDPDGLRFVPFATQFSAWLTQSTIMGLVIGVVYFMLRRNELALDRVHKALEEREQMQQELMQSEGRFRLISSVTSDYTFSSTLNAQGGLDHTFLTGAFEAITGYTPDDYMKAGGWRGTLHPDDKEQDARDFAALQHNEPVVSELRFFKKGGEVRWAKVSAQPIWDAERHQLVGISGGVKDITERKQVENALRESEERFRTFVHQSPNGIMLTDEQGVIIEWNNALVKLSGLPQRDAVGQPLWQVQHKLVAEERRSPEFLHLLKERVEVTIKTGKSYLFNRPIETVLHHPDSKETTPVQQTGFSIQTKDGWRVGAIVEDITERKQLQDKLQAYTGQLEQLVDERTNELRLAKEQFELVLNNAANALAFADSNGNILVENPAFRTTFERGESSIEFVLWALVNEEQMASVSKALLKAIYDNETQRLETQVLCDGGGEKDVELLFIPVSTLDKDGTTKSGVLLSGHDITQMKEVERFKAQFVADAVHDLATPITGLSNRLYLLNRSPEKLAEHTRALENQVKHLRNLLEDLRTLAWMDRGKITLQKSPCQIDDLLQRVFDTYEPVALNKQQSLTLKIAPDLPEICLDQQQFSRVLVNLVSNAVNYTPEGKEIYIEATVEDAQLVVRVGDQGMGIGAENLSRIFDRFFRTDEARISLSDGTGLGLAITKEIMEMHGGSVSVTSELKKGSTFIVRLPL